MPAKFKREQQCLVSLSSDPVSVHSVSVLILVSDVDQIIRDDLQGILHVDPRFLCDPLDPVVMVLVEELNQLLHFIATLQRVVLRVFS